MHAIEYRRVALVVTLALGAAAAPASAQLRPSEKFALVQIIDGDTIMITGSRPSQRGRDLYGSPNVPWGKSWTPGADMATVLRVDRDFSINGTAIEQGSYSIWMIPRDNDEWTLFLDPNAQLFHTAHPDTVGQRYVIPLVARTVAPVETLAWTINDIKGWRSRVELTWAGKAVDFDLRLSAGELNLAADAAQGKRIAGTYEITPENRQEPFMVDRLVVRYADGALKWRFEGGNAPDWVDGTEWVMAPRGGETFGWYMMHNGEVVGQLPWAVLEIPEGGDRAEVIEIRVVPEDKMFVRAVRRSP
jgi:hypothetical protein